VYLAATVIALIAVISLVPVISADVVASNGKAFRREIPGADAGVQMLRNFATGSRCGMVRRPGMESLIAGVSSLAAWRWLCIWDAYGWPDQGRTSRQAVGGQAGASSNAK